MSNFPCWLSPGELEQAQALLDLGFVYCGDVDNFCELEPCGKVGSWQFGTAPGEVCMDAVCNGALYSWCLETHPNFDDDGFFETRLKEAKSTILQVIRKQSEQVRSQYQQLSLFEVN
ncbi:hypothetical protein ACE1CI_32875 [Aerosakkonemataceae cyanobacterium BLCC-F50]|uniref:Uncharacterized protein n=1 Tax=Floridaenema flaviceps BLCC-F50 TaxID=3153642 RepID=A0ABV4Y1B5_9CYAN